MIEEVSYIKPPYVVQRGTGYQVSYVSEREEIEWEFHSAYVDLKTAETEARKLAEYEEHARTVKR